MKVQSFGETSNQLLGITQLSPGYSYWNRNNVVEIKCYKKYQPCMGAVLLVINCHNYLKT